MSWAAAAPGWVWPLLIVCLTTLPIHGVPVDWDGLWYMTIAENVQNGRGLVDAGLTPVGNRPVFPLILAAAFAVFGASPLVGLIVIRSFFALTAVLIYILARDLHGKTAAIIASLLVVTSGALNHWSTLTSIDLVLPAFLLVFLILAYRAFKTASLALFVASGVALSLACLVKETALPLVAVPPLFWLMARGSRTRRNAIGVVLLLLAAALPLAAWGAAHRDGIARNTRIDDSASHTTFMVSALVLDEEDNGSVVALLSRAIEALTSYYDDHLAAHFALAPFFLLALLTVLFFAARRRPPYLYQLAVFVSLLPQILVQGLIGFRSRQSMIVFLVLYIALAAGVAQIGIGLGRWLAARHPGNASRWFWWPARRAAWILFAALLALQTVRDPRTSMAQHLHSFNSLTYFLGPAKDNGLQALGTWQQVAEWMERNLVAGSTVLGNRWNIRAAAYLTRGKFVFHGLPHLPITAGRQTAEAGSGSERPILLYLDEFGNTQAQDLVFGRLVAVTQEGVARAVRDRSARYLLTGGEATALASFFLCHPGFSKVADFQQGLIQIFQVLPASGEPLAWRPGVTTEALLFMDTLASRDRERHASLRSRLRQRLGFDPAPIGERQGESARLIDSTRKFDYAEFAGWCSDSLGEAQALDIQLSKAAGEPDSPWPHVAAGALRLSGGPEGAPEQRLELGSADLALAVQLGGVEPGGPLQVVRGLYKRHEERLGSAPAEVLVQLLEAATSRRSDDPSTSLELAQTYQLLGREQQAADLYRAILEKWPANPTAAKAHLPLAILCEQLGELTAAKRHYREAIRLEPARAEPYRRLARMYQREGKSAEALRLLRGAARRNPGAAWPQVALAGIYLEMQQGDTAGD